MNREVLDYCEADTRLVADLLRWARRDGELAVDGYPRKGSERIEVERLGVAVEVPHGATAPPAPANATMMGCQPTS